MNNLKLSISMFATLFLFLASNSSAQVTVYEHNGYSGSSINFPVGNHDITSGGFNDIISSIKVQPGYKVTVYKDYRFSGASYVLTSSASSLGNFNDVISSLKVEKIAVEPKPQSAERPSITKEEVKEQPLTQPVKEEAAPTRTPQRRVYKQIR